MLSIIQASGVLSSSSTFACVVLLSDERARDRSGAGQDDGAVPFPAGEGRVRAVLQAAPRQAASAQQVRLRRQRKEHDL